MSTSKLQVLLDSTVAQFNDLKNGGSITLPEVLKIATGVFKEICTIKALSTDEKKGLVFLALQRGLKAAGPLQGLSHVDPGIVSEVEKQSLHVAVMAVFALGDAFPQAFAELQGFLSYIRCFLSKYLPACSEAAAAVSVLDPADGALIAEAVKALKAVTAPPASDPVADPAPAPAAAAPAAPAPAASPPALVVRTVETSPESVGSVAQNEAPK